MQTGKGISSTLHAQRKRCGSLCAIWSRKHGSTCLSIRTAGRRLSNLTPAAPFCSHLTTRCANWKRKDKAFCSSVPLCTDAPSLAFACSSDMAYAGRTCAEAASRAGAETAPMRNRSDTHTLRALSKAGRKQNAFGGFDNDSYCVPFPCGTASAAGRFFRFSIDGRALFMLHLKKKAAIRQCSATAAHQNRGGPA